MGSDTGIVTVPAGVIEALGGLRESDPGIVWGRPPPDLGAFWSPWHPAANTLLTFNAEQGAHYRLLLPASSAALARALARSLGFELEDCCIPELTDWHTGGARLGVAGNYVDLDVPTCRYDYDMPRARALAECVVWEARKARVAAAVGPDASWADSFKAVADTDEELTATEAHLGLPEWRVEEGA